VGVAGVLAVEEFISVPQHELGVAEHFPGHRVLRVPRHSEAVTHPDAELAVILDAGGLGLRCPVGRVLAGFPQQQSLVAVHHALPGAGLFGH
jgi:hypothetical protein